MFIQTPFCRAPWIHFPQHTCSSRMRPSGVSTCAQCFRISAASVSEKPDRKCFMTSVSMPASATAFGKGSRTCRRGYPSQNAAHARHSDAGLHGNTHVNRPQHVGWRLSLKCITQCAAQIADRSPSEVTGIMRSRTIKAQSHRGRSTNSHLTSHPHPVSTH